LTRSGAERADRGNVCTLQLPNGDTAETIGDRVITESGKITLSCRWPGALIGVF
jgi:hypothetical protein